MNDRPIDVLADATSRSDKLRRTMTKPEDLPAEAAQAGRLSPASQDSPPSSGRRRSLGIYLLALANLLLCALALLSLRLLAGAEQYALKDSPEIGADLDAALAGLSAMRWGLALIAGGFAASALGVFSLTRIGWWAQFLWAALACLSLLGLPYGLPALVFLLRETTRARCFGSGSRDEP